jgi:glycosyltransferase involved in cell wall biosynthesis
MKVLIITSTVSEKSGWGRYSRAVVEYLVSAGIEVELFSEEDPVGLAVTWHHLHSVRSRFSITAIFKNIWNTRAAAKYITVVHALDGWPFGMYGYGAVLGRNKKLFINGVGTYSVAPLYTFWVGWILKRAYAKAEKIFCISNYTKKQIEESGIAPQKLQTVHMGRLQLPDVSSEKADRYRKEFGIPQESFPIILTVGSIKDRKGQFETLQAVSILQKKYPNILYIVAGSGNDQKYIEKLKAYASARHLSENLLVISNADDEALAFLYSICSVFALNSNTDTQTHHFEGFGLVVIEACQFGKPSVGSVDCGVEDAIADGKTGLLTHQRDPADIAEKVEQILARYDFFSHNAALWYTAFDWKKTVAAYIDFYNS